MIHHLDLTVTDRARSMAWYDLVLGRLGWRRIGDYAGDVPCWAPPGDARTNWSLGLHEARSTVPHDRYAPGLHHLALRAGSRAQVDEFHNFLAERGIVVLDAPAEYDYSPGYYAVFFADPDGLKLELVHEP